jgi:hypothetical protein
MKKYTILSALIFSLVINNVCSQAGNDTIAYLLTCNPGTETYSIYGHSALRIVDNINHTDVVYNWGVFDFETPAFAWKFAKGRLDYMLITEKMDNFLRTYLYEKRSVYSQRINLRPSELRTLTELVAINLRPENVKYRYDFFYDDCSTRIRDLIEKSLGKSLVYPPDDAYEKVTFRDLTGKYQAPYPWLQFGIDLIMGSPGDKKASFRDRMFLPLDMQAGLSETLINREGKMGPLLQNPETLLDFDLPSMTGKSLFVPENVFSLFLIILIITIPLIKKRKIIDIIDIVIFLVFSVLACMMIFFNFFTDHQQMKLNLNILWLNPFLLICLLYLIINKPAITWFRIIFFISALFLLTHMLLPQDFNRGILPLVLIMVYRSSARAGFSWNPFTLK